MILSIFLLFLGLFIIFYLLVKMRYINVESFQNTESEIIRREIRADYTDNLTNLKIANPVNEGDPGPTNRIFVGNHNEDMFPSTMNTLATNNTIFIKDGLKISNGTEDEILNLDKIKQIKYLPYNFKDKLCLGDSCINKHHIKIIKGRKPFKLNTFISAKPFRIFSEPGYGGWAMGVTTQSNSNINLRGNGVKSVRISDPNYIMTAYAEANYQGKKIDISGEGSSDLTGIFPKGFKSYQARSATGNLLKNYCFKHSQIVHAPDNLNNVIQAVPCDQSSDVYYIVRTDDIDNKEHGDSCDVDFHVHQGNEGYHHNLCEK